MERQFGNPVKNNNYVEVKRILESGFNVNRSSYHDSNGESYTIGCLICNAERDGHLEIVTMLLDHDADINKTNNLGETAPHLAAPNDEINVARHLISRNANVNTCDKSGNTFLHEASCKGHLGIVTMLLDHGADINKTKWSYSASPCGI